MAIAVERETLHPTQAVVSLGELGWLAIAAGGSLGAGAIHAAAIGVHSEHRQAVVAFTIVAAIQIGWGAIMLARPGRLLLTLGVLANIGIVGGWILAKTSGISFVDGLEAKESPQFADAVAAGLAVMAVLAAVAYLISRRSGVLANSPLLTGFAAIALAGLSLPGMLSAGSHTHAAGGHGHADVIEEPAAAVPPKVFDPSLPIDLSGVPGVTLEQQARAENLLSITLTRLPKFSDPATLEALGFQSIGDGLTGTEHYINRANMADGKILDPDFPESLVFDMTTTPKHLAAAMYMLEPGATLADTPDIGGKLTQWHVHSNLCFAGERVAGLTDSEGNCADGLVKGPEIPMIHVWIQSHPCGPFASLEGIGAGQVAEGEVRNCDHVHGDP